MRVIPSSAGERDFDGLLRFLGGCREEARRVGEARIAHICLRVGHLDPLAVLESIVEPGELHFYLERSMREEAVAGADAVASCRAGGEGRFARARDFIATTLARTICIGDLDAPFAGPHFFCSFAFGDDEAEEAPFPAATVFLPRWQVARRGDDYSAAANLQIGPEADVEALATKVWRAHAKFSSFDYRHAAETGRGLPLAQVKVLSGSTRREEFAGAVREALDHIRQGRVGKVVLARHLEVELPAALHPLHALNRLRMVYPNCYTYSVANGRGQSFIGASPELLARRKGALLETEALAGSAPRGRTAAEDATLAEALLRSDKDGREHRLVIGSIQRRLEKLGLKALLPETPRLLQLANVQHLRTPVTADLPPGLHLLDVLAELHPTPAVGGTPRDGAKELIRRLETFSRGLYAGAIGWVDAAGEGEFTVAIRSTLIDGTSARLYAGAGIVEGSDPEREWQETEVKLRAVLEALSEPR